MALHIGRHIGRKQQHGTSATPVASARRPWWPRRTGRTEPAAGPAGDRAAKTVVVERKPRRWRRSRHNPVSAMILAAGWAAAAILALGMLLTGGNANPGNDIVDATLDAGRWLATQIGRAHV